MRFDIERYRELYPFESHWFDVGGARMHYLDEGAGEPMVMVHGNPTWSAYYRRLVQAFRDSHRVIAADHIGCGLSDTPPESEYTYTLERRVDDLERLLDHLELDRNVTLVVHDWGGMIGVATALRRSERIARLVILNTAAFLKPAGKPLPWQLAFIKHTPLLPAFLLRGLNMFARSATTMAVTRSLPRNVRDLYLAPYHSWHTRLAVLRFVQDIPISPRDAGYAIVESVDRNLAKLRDVPMLICWGAKDFVFDTDYYAEWRRRFPDAEAHLYEDAGHYVLEDAGDRVIERMRAFLDRHPLSSAENSEAVGTRT